MISFLQMLMVLPVLVVFTCISCISYMYIKIDISMCKTIDKFSKNDGLFSNPSLQLMGFLYPPKWWILWIWPRVCRRRCSVVRDFTVNLLVMYLEGKVQGQTRVGQHKSAHILLIIGSRGFSCTVNL